MTQHKNYPEDGFVLLLGRLNILSQEPSDSDYSATTPRKGFKGFTYTLVYKEPIM